MDEHISSSQLTMWMRCPKQYEFRYIKDVKIPPRISMARGTSAHRAWEVDHLQKVQSKENMAIDDVKSVYSDEFDKRATEIEIMPDEDAGKIKDEGVRMVEVYHENISKRVQPIAAEEPFTIDLHGFQMKGVIDLITDAGEIRDAKTSSKKKSEIPFDHYIQMAIYAKAKPEYDNFILDNAIVSPKKSELESLTLNRSDLPFDRVERYMEAFSESLTKGIFPPTSPDAWVCSAKWCGYHTMCPYFTGKKE